MTSSQQLQIRPRHATARRWLRRGHPGALLLVLLPLFAFTSLLIALVFYTPAVQEDRRGNSQDWTLLDAAPSPAFCLRDRPPLICAHGGDAPSSGTLRNTVPAFQAAMQGGFHCVELDVAQTLDGHLVTLHTRELERMEPAQHGLQVTDLTLRQIQQLRGPSGEKVPFAADVIRLLQPVTHNLTLDIKLQERAAWIGEEDMARAVVDLISETGCGQCLVWCKRDVLVRHVLELSRGQRCGHIVQPGEDSTPADVQLVANQLQRLQECQVVGVHHMMVTEELVDAAHEAGQLVHAWTADTPAMMVSMLDAGADAIVTSYPALLRQAITLRMAKCTSMMGLMSVIDKDSPDEL